MAMTALVNSMDALSMRDGAVTPDSISNTPSAWIHISPNPRVEEGAHPSLGSLGPSDSVTSVQDSAVSSAVGSPALTKRKPRKGPHLKLPSITPGNPLPRPPDSAGSDDQSASHLTNREYISPPAIEIPKGCYLTELREEDLNVVAELGSGNGGVVQKVWHKSTNTMMARKLIHVESKAKIRKMIVRELRVLHDCHHPNIITFYGAFHRDNDISICMEYMDVGSLHALLQQAGPLPEEVIARISLSMLLGLVYLHHELRILHRDVKPSNVLVNSRGEVKLCDFGVAGMTVNSVAETFVGTSNYMSPERIQGAPYSNRSDVWSLGIMAIELALGHHPYPSAASAGGAVPILELIQNIVNEPPPSLPDSKYSPEFCDFVDRCLKKEASQRSAPKELLRHPFVTKKGGDGKLDPEWLKKVTVLT
ncbi:Pkinase-domain-containing protein [Gonapodya prolifera JEL478]|uniref:mitogen-activated protein kinase kinase n=1 Tax=Gonapodya prolifera (strain JEL478) TaxID=1344416 RepID=A0A139A7G4_GONPJ|nr:Pkinase-domain-containing protein [Gonapodya prolifera JEL478]|eukprot:KXS12629.1 Pkinase-domain-containing protein [Gonapodya prolifera JEL478]